MNLLSLVKLWTNLSSQQKNFGQIQQTQQKMFFGQIFAEFAGFDQKFVEFVTTLQGNVFLVKNDETGHSKWISRYMIVN